MDVIIVSCSLGPKSKSGVLAEAAIAELHKQQASSKLLDVRDTPLPICDGGPAFADPNVAVAKGEIEKASAILLASPIYNFDVNAVAKNLIELTGKAWENKVVGFLCSAGGQASYMSVMGVANSLMLDFRCIIIPGYVYATGDAFDENNKIVSNEIKQRIKQLCTVAVRLGRAVKAFPE